MSFLKKSASNKGTTGTTNIIDSFYFLYGFKGFLGSKMGEKGKIEVC